ncbi:alpha/beta hydrolase [Candidatus Enterococcus ikei]|uniref:Alpha/beta hydrolase n=1 Tax=Candidatus Enterococcus ikei TaxID=2815326 RepID=A0ABS3GZ31_9ENTE|nr:alpha/beta hydrolase [Enterococcus sp. DIV0869a]MBO0440509.1 alpha/beta hydrolase [Enterococcus sp. DIV0869a]
MNNTKNIKRKLPKIFLIVGVVLMLFLLFQKSLTAFAEKFVQNSEPVEIQAPTILVPGTNGTVNRFNGLIKSLDPQADVLKVTVATDGTVSSKGKLTSSTKHPMIVIAFKDSSNSTLPVQGKWYQLALSYIQEKYSFETYNYLGHSNGGLVITSYLEEFQQATDPKLAKLITLGTPYNDTPEKYNEAVTSFTQLKETSDLLKGYLKNLENIPNTIEMLNIAGEVDDTASDNTVPVQSVYSGRYIYQDQVAEYQEVLIQGENASHSELVENQKVVQLLKDFFW